MATSSVLGIDQAEISAPGRDTASLGPSDTSDTGSDIAGLDEFDDSDPSMPIDVALDPDAVRPHAGSDVYGAGVDSDASGTGEARSATGDAGLREAADIGVDRIVDDPNESALQDDVDDIAADAALQEAIEASRSVSTGGSGNAVMDDAEDEEADEEDESSAFEVEDESADPVGDGRAVR